MKRLIQTSACLALALSFLSLPALSQTQDNAADNAAPDLGPVLERLDQVIAGLAKVSGDLAKLQKASSSNAKDKSLKTATKQLTDLNTASQRWPANSLAKPRRPKNKPAPQPRTPSCSNSWSTCKPPPGPKPSGRLHSTSGSTNQFLATAASRSRRK